MIVTTLEQIRQHSPCGPGWKSLLRGLNKRGADTEPLTIGRIATVSTLADALWSIKSVIGQEQELRNLAFISYGFVKSKCSKQVVQILTDAMHDWNYCSSKDFEFNSSSFYNAVDGAIKNQFDSIALASLHSDARWASRYCALSVVKVNAESEFQIRKVL